jgi:hypothetical protein
MVTVPDMTGWTEVTSAAGETLGWMAPADVETPHERAHRIRVAGLRADAIDQAARLFDSAFTPDEVKDMWAASGLSGDDLDAAANVALELWTVEQERK